MLFVTELRLFIIVNKDMNEIIFIVEEAPEGGYTAKALSHSIYTEADSMKELKAHIRDAILCHFDEEMLPKVARLHFVKDEVFAIA